jgi:hypothetical protein
LYKKIKMSQKKETEVLVTGVNGVNGIKSYSDDTRSSEGIGEFKTRGATITEVYGSTGEAYDVALSNS